MTNWARRPLALQQAEYAALDALILCRAHNEMERQRLRQGGGAAHFYAHSHAQAEVHCACAVRVVAAASGGGGRDPPAAGLESEESCVVRVVLKLGRTFAPLREEEE